MKYEESVKKILVVIIMIVAFAIGTTLVVSLFMKDSGGPSTQQADDNRIVEKNKVSDSRLPEKFPTNLPTEPNAVVTQNYNAVADDGRFQATRTYETTKTLPENLTIYRQYLNSNGWDIESTVDQPTYKKISGKKGIQKLQVSISENETTKVKTVSISLTELP